jgi:hypothetical protein
MMTPLHAIGDLLRYLFLLVPLPAAKILFIALPLVVLVWVLTLPRSATAIDEAGSRASDLKWWASLALIIQIAIYAWAT